MRLRERLDGVEVAMGAEGAEGTEGAEGAGGAEGVEREGKKES